MSPEAPGITRTLARGSIARLVSFHHHPTEPHVDPAEESVRRASIVFTIGGRWGYSSVREAVQVSPDKVLLLNAHEPYSCTHECRAPADRNLCLELDAPEGFRFERAWVPFSPRWGSLLTWMAREERAAEPGHRLAVDGLASSLVVDVVRGSPDDDSLPEAAATARAFLDLNFRADIGLKDVARAASVSPFHLAREFKRHVGTTPRQYLIEARIKEAKILLKDTRMTVTEIGDACGFNSTSHFSTTFRARTGLSPLRFRRS